MADRPGVIDPIRAWPLVGRRREIEVLAGWVGAAAAAGVVLFGAPGVGKTRLADEVAQRISGTHTVRRVRAGATVREVPLGAFADWIDGADGDPRALVRRLIGALSAGAAPVVVVDDVHLLDDLSVFVVTQLVVRKLARVLLTARTGEPMPAAITALWKDQRLRRCELQPLPEPVLGELLGVVLDGPIDPDSVHRLHQLGGGNGLFLRCLVDQELAAGRLAPRRGLWSWSGWAAASGPLVELVEAHMGRIGTDLAVLIDLLAVGGPVEPTVLAALVGPETLEEAEQRGLVTVTWDRCAMVQLGHPLYGVARLAACADPRLRALRTRLARAQLPSATVDPARLALLWVDSDLPPDGAVLGAGAAAAAQRLDAALAERLTRECLSLGADPELAVLRAHMLVLLIRSREAEETMAGLGHDQLDDATYADLLMVRSANLLWSLADPAAAAELVRASHAGCGPQSRIALQTAQAQQLACAGRPAAALTVLSNGGSGPVGDLPAVNRCWARVQALADLGRVAEMLDCAQRGIQISEGSSKAAYQGVGLTEYVISGCLNAGLVAEAEAAAEHVHRRCADVPGLAAVVASALVGLADFGAGRVDSALTRLSGAVAMFEQLGDTSGLVYVYRIALAGALARSGDIDGARAAEDAIPACRHPSFGYLGPDALLSRAWVAGSTGGRDRARMLSLEAAQTARDNGQRAREVIALQTAVGFGATDCAHRLQQLAGQVEGPRASVAADYADAAGHGDGQRILVAAEAFAALGDPLTAADAAGLAAGVSRAAGRRGEEYRATGRARRLLAGTGATSPMLRDAVTELPLSQREFAVAALAAEGLSNREIADRLVASVRTVEGHLYRAGSKLGVGVRAGLTAVVREWAWQETGAHSSRRLRTPEEPVGTTMTVWEHQCSGPAPR